VRGVGRDRHLFSRSIGPHLHEWFTLQKGSCPCEVDEAWACWAAWLLVYDIGYLFRFVIFFCLINLAT
jgi:hypothetical protein